MKLFRLAAWTVWFMLSWTALAHAGFIGVAIGAIAGALAKGGIAALLIKTAFGIALQVGATLLRRAMARKQRQPGITGQLQVGGDNSVSFIVGHYATAGSLEYTGEWGKSGKTPNAYHVQVVTLSDLPQAGLRNRVWINGQQCTIDFEATPAAQGYPVIEYRQKGRDYLWVKYLDGSQTVADSYLTSSFSGHSERPWLSDMIGRGCTMVVLTALVNRELLTQIPAGRYEPEALPVYDPRKDTTLGGSGSHRWGQPETYEPSGNPIVIIYNLLRGIFYDGELIYGPAIPGTRLPLANWFAAMNECDIPVDVEGGGTEPQFRCGYEIKVAEDEPIEVINDLLKACNGKIAEIGGIYKVHVGAPGLPVFFVTDEDFVVTEEQEFDPFPGLESTVNGAAATYPEPLAGWEMKDAPQRLFPDLEEEDDGRRLLVDFQLGAVPYAAQVQRLMKSLVKDHRRFRRHRGTLPPSAFVLEPFDVVSWTSAREGYVAKQFPIDGIDDLVNANQAVALREADPADFDWDFSTDELPWSVGPLVPNWPVAQPMTGWQAFAAYFPDAAGNPRRPSIEVRFDGDEDDVRAVRIIVRLMATGAIVFDAEIPYGEPLEEPGFKSAILNGVFLPDTEYEVQGQFIPYSGRATEPSSWLYVKTDDIRFSGDDVYLPGVIDEIIEIVDDNYSFIGRDLRDVIDEVRRMALKVIDQDYANFNDKKELRTELVSTTENITAKYTSLVTAATGPGSAIVQRLESLEATIPGLATATALNALTLVVEAQGSTITAQGAAITAIELELPSKASVSAVTVLSGRVDTVEGVTSAQANAITSLSAASTSGNVATANQRFAVSAGPTGYAARLSWEARAGGSGTYRSASIFIDVPTSTGAPTRVVVVGDQFVVTDGTNISRPMVFQSGVLTTDQLRVNGAHIMDLTVGLNQIAVNAVTVPYIVTTSAQASQSGTDVNFTIYGPSVPFAATDVGISGSVIIPVVSGGTAITRIYNFNVYATQGANEYRVGVFREYAPNAQSGTYFLGCAITFVPPTAGTYNFRVEINISSGGSRTYTPDPGAFSVLRHRR